MNYWIGCAPTARFARLPPPTTPKTGHSVEAAHVGGAGLAQRHTTWAGKPPSSGSIRRGVLHRALLRPDASSRAGRRGKPPQDVSQWAPASTDARGGALPPLATPPVLSAEEGTLPTGRRRTAENYFLGRLPAAETRLQPISLGRYAIVRHPLETWIVIAGVIMFSLRSRILFGCCTSWTPDSTRARYAMPVRYWRPAKATSNGFLASHGDLDSPEHCLSWISRWIDSPSRFLPSRLQSLLFRMHGGPSFKNERATRRAFCGVWYRREGLVACQPVIQFPADRATLWTPRFCSRHKGVSVNTILKPHSGYTTSGELHEPL